MKKLLTITACVLSLCYNAQTTEKRDISAFNKIDASGAAHIIYESSSNLSLNIEGDATEIKQIETFVKNNNLFIKTKGNFKKPFKIKISGSGLNELDLSGASHFEAKNQVKTDVFTLKASGASHVEIPLSAKSVKTEIDGASHIDLSGETNELVADLSGASKLKASDLKSVNTTIKASGASTAQVCAANKLSTNCSGASSIKYKGEPKDVYKKSNDASSVDRMN